MKAGAKKNDRTMLSSKLRSLKICGTMQEGFGDPITRVKFVRLMLSSKEGWDKVAIMLQTIIGKREKSEWDRQ